MRCNHCTDAPCVKICPTQALFTREDGIVDFDRDRCIGCKSCMQGCPYDAIYIDEDTNTAAKCNFCAHRVDEGLEPACVVVCPTHSIWVGDLDDPESGIARLVNRNPVTVRAPEQDTGPERVLPRRRPRGARPAGGAGRRHLHLLDARRAPRRGRRRPAAIDPITGARTTLNTAAPAPVGLAGHHLPVDQGRRRRARCWSPRWRCCSASTSACSARCVAPALGVAGVGDHRRAAGLGPQAARAVLLHLHQAQPDVVAVLGLGGPRRVRGGVRRLAAGRRPRRDRPSLGPATPFACCAVPAILAAVMVAGYTAFLFGQAEGRDLWQSPLLFWHLIVQAVDGRRRRPRASPRPSRGPEPLDCRGVASHSCAAALVLGGAACCSSASALAVTGGRHAAARRVTRGRRPRVLVARRLGTAPRPFWPSAVPSCLLACVVRVVRIQAAPLF